jgi:hypothetical protein
MNRLAIAALAAFAAASGCRQVDLVQPGRRPTPSTRNEAEAEETLRRSFQYLIDGNVDAAYGLICTRDREKKSLNAYRQEYEANRDKWVQMARQAQIVGSGEATLPDGSPYVTVIVNLGKSQAGQREVVPYSLVLEPGGWRIILLDPHRARQSDR